MHIKLDHMHIEPHGKRTMSKHQLRAELGKLGHLAAAIWVILKAYPLIFFPEICLLFPIFHWYPWILHSDFMPVCSIVQTITPRYRGQPEALLPKAECNSASGRPRYRRVIVWLYYKQAWYNCFITQPFLWNT